MIRKKWGRLGLGLALGLTSCGSSHHSPAAAGSSTSVAPSTAAGAPAGGGTTTEPTASGTPIVASTTGPSGPARCATAALGASLTGANGTAGSIYYALVLTNRGAVVCVLQGYPGVSFVTGSSGQQLGAPAGRIPGSAPSFDLAPGASSRAVLQITDASNYGASCQLTATDGLRVYPPSQTASLFVAHDDHGCANQTDVTLHVGAFQPPA
jgi:hypothetical protein